MRNMKRTKAPHVALRMAGLVACIGAVAAFNMAEADACDSCNEAFTRSILAERSDSLSGADIINAMEQQKGLPLTGLTSERLAEAAQIRMDKPLVVAQADTGGAKVAAP